MYAEDSFFTLTMTGRLGLVALSALLGGLTLALFLRLSRGQYLVWRLSLALVLFFAFVWLSPQIYYAYYQLLIGDLPWQIVIGSPPTASDLFKQLSFQERHNLSYHSRGALGWLLIVLALFQRRMPR
ncbi:MAG: hypothetical protein ABJM29_10115 [Rhizobiaceae bacterium]